MYKVYKFLFALMLSLSLSLTTVSAGSYTIKASNVYYGKTATFKINKIAKGDYVTVKAGSKSYRKSFTSAKSAYSYKVKMPKSGRSAVVTHFNKSKKKLVKKTFTIKKKKSSSSKKATGSTVYITATGNKYHRGSCSCLRRSKIKISKSKAKARGYKACKLCRP